MYQGLFCTKCKNRTTNDKFSGCLQGFALLCMLSQQSLTIQEITRNTANFLGAFRLEYDTRLSVCSFHLEIILHKNILIDLNKTCILKLQILAAS